MVSSPKTKLTLNITKSVLENAKKESRSKNIPLSRMVERFLVFMADPKLWCFKCGNEFSSSKTDVCPECSYLICDSCKACSCSLDKQSSVAVYHMRRVYEYLLGGRLK